jgi:ABC-type polysaccharide/polyol phosphate transport system ATPase subunit/ABC-type polysaccharide/polyol phosphate export permease
MTVLQPDRFSAPTDLEVAISVRGLSKRFKLPEERHSSVREQLLHPRHRGATKLLTALTDVSFDVHRGSCVGIVGRNGSGKSTLLRCVSGIYVPEAGQVRIRGRMASFIELGLGFDRELSALENLITSGMLFGMSARELRSRFDEILSYAGLEEFADVKLKNYSTGMATRLGFALTTHVDADVLLFDEGVATGDLAFQQKGVARLEQLRAEGRTLVFVSHDMDAIQAICDRALLLERGRVVFEGDGTAVAERYDAINLGESPDSEERRTTRRRQRSLSGRALSRANVDARTPRNDLRDVSGTNHRRMARIAARFALVKYRLKYRDAALGYAWAVMRPLATFGVMYLVFTKVAHFNFGVPHYAVYLLSSLVLWTFFLDATTNAIFSLVREAELLRKAPVPRAAMPVAVVLRALLDLGMNLIAVIVFLAVSRISPRVTWLEVPLLVVVLTCLALGIAFLMSALYVTLRDIDQLWAVLAQILFYGSSILYVITAVPSGLRRAVILLNPLAAIFTQMRHALIDPLAPSAATVAGGAVWLLVPLAIVALLGVGGIAVFARVSPTVAEYL